MKYTCSLSLAQGARKLLTATMLAILLSACAVGPEYRRAEMPSSPSFRNAPDAHAIANSSWWRGFGDTTLNELLKQALARSQNIIQAIARLEQAQAGANHALALQRPSTGRLACAVVGQSRASWR